MAQYRAPDPGYELKRTYQSNLMLSMILVYGTVVLAIATALLLRGPSTLRVESVLVVAGHLPSKLSDGGKSGQSFNQRDSSGGESGLQAVELAGMFSFGGHRRIIPDHVVGKPAPAPYRTGIAEVPQPEINPELSPDELNMAASGSGDEVGDYGLPEIPIANSIGSPVVPEWEMRRQIKGGRTRAARVYFGGLDWPNHVPTAAQCTVFVEVTFYVDGHLEWDIERCAVDSAYTSFIPLFKRQVETALRRTWFLAAMLNGVRVNQIAHLQAIFCPGCEPQVWSERGDMEVFLRK